MLTPFAKAIAAGIALLLNTFIAAYGDDVLSMDEKQQFFATVLTVGIGIYGVWKTRNTPPTTKKVGE